MCQKRIANKLDSIKVQIYGIHPINQFNQWVINVHVKFLFEPDM